MSKTRLNLLLVFVFLLAGLLIHKLYVVQIAEADHWVSQAERQQRIRQEVEGGRGSIFAVNKDNESIPLAINRSWQKVYISPREILREEEDKAAVAAALSDILEIDEDSIFLRMERDSSFEVLKRQLSDEEISAISQLDFSGIHLREESIRFYPQSQLASHVVGFVGGSEIGQYGVEGYYEDLLRGMGGVREGWRNPGGSIIMEDSAKSGMSIDLTIDYNIQFMAERLLEESVERLNAVSGTIIVANPNTGEIIAMTNYPTYDPNNYREADIATFKNDSIQSLFEPGSVFKPIVMAMAIEEDVVTPQTTYYDKGYEIVSGYTLRNYGQRAFGEVDMREVMERSINTGMVFVQQRMEKSVFMDYLAEFGFFERTGIDLQGEVYSENLSFKEGYDVNLANASFGQGIKITPIQLVSAFSTLANGGELITPYVARNFNPEPDRKRRVLSSGTTTKITSMLISTVEDGTARRAQIPGYYIAGKTGTAQIPWSLLGENRRGYSRETIQSFIGYGPLRAEFVILVKMERPQAPTAEVSVVPVFRDLAKYIIDYKQIPPDYVRE